MTKNEVDTLIESRGADKYADVMRDHGYMLEMLKRKDLSHERKAYLSMVFHKLARLLNSYGNENDNLLDIAGYSELERREAQKGKENVA